MEQRIEKQEISPYKFQALKVYACTEWLAGNRKQYRQVYDAHDTGYLYAELSFINKKFDQESWQVDIDLKCYEFDNHKSLCDLHFKRKVNKYDHTVYIREGWGNKKPGHFWKKGTYYWEAYINGELVGTKYFYVIDSFEAPQQNLLKLESIKLYEGQYDDVNEDDRIYWNVMSYEETRYIYVEVKFENLHLSDNWECELFTRFFNSTHELKGQVVRLRKVNRNEVKITFTSGWGSNVKGSWLPGEYSVELMFMGEILATVNFELGETFEEGLPEIIYPDHVPCVLLNPIPNDDDSKTFEEIMVELDSLIGLNHIKKQVRDHATYIKFLQLRKEKGFKEEENINVHSVFTGNPGTGKTTVARLLGKLYKKMGLLSLGHIHEVDRADLVGEYIGQTAPKVKEQIKKARGGVLFIDEAYALARSNDDSKDFGREVIEILVKEMSNGPGDMAVVVAGYPKEMKHFIDSNPGLKSRFKHFFEFTDYVPQELTKIAQLASTKKEVEISPDASKLIHNIIVESYRTRDRNFGNARFVYDLIEKAKVNMGLRLMSMENTEDLDRTELMQIRKHDVEKIDLVADKLIPNIPVDDILLIETLGELNALIGIENVKKEIHELVEVVKYHKKRGRQVLNNYYLHTIFIGNPGTGKTTVARILTKIYKALGILERGHMVETDRQGLVAGFVGQTAIKTSERIDEAMGGVLFIDEAYALSNFNGLQGDYGNEAIQTILKRMEDNRGEFFVFAAGYPDNMDVFLKSNPGLNSRFDKRLVFHDYSPTELVLIASKMLNDQEYTCDDEATVLLNEYLIHLHKRRDKFFGNARTVRVIILQLIKVQNLRLAKEFNDVSSTIITAQDVRDFIREREEDKPIQKNIIGFKN